MTPEDRLELVSEMMQDMAATLLTMVNILRGHNEGEDTGDDE